MNRTVETVFDETIPNRDLSPNKDNVKKRLSAVTESGSLVSIVPDYGLDDRGSIPDRGRAFFL
jgi:hypothetical protein